MAFLFGSFYLGYYAQAFSIAIYRFMSGDVTDWSRIGSFGSSQLIKEKSMRLAGTEVTFQYSPESFSATEVEFSLEICEAVMDVWGPTPESPIILNLPETVFVPRRWPRCCRCSASVFRPATPSGQPPPPTASPGHSSRS